MAWRRVFPERWWARFLWVFFSYILCADVLPVLLMLVVNCVGYLPYSDRPGPGWQPAHLPSREELQFFLGFSSMLAIGSAMYAAVFSAAAGLFEALGIPRWLTRVLFVGPVFLAVGLMMSAAGWMIAISAFGVYLASGCGLLWALIVLPSLLRPRPGQASRWLRYPGPIALTVCCLALFLRSALPDPATTDATVFVIEQTPLGKPLSELDWSTFGGSPHLDPMPGTKFAPVSFSTHSMSAGRKSRVLVILSDEKSVGKKLDVPRTGDAVYLETDGQWQTLQKAARKASFGLVVSRDRVDVSGNCCQSDSVQYFPLPKQ